MNLNQSRGRPWLAALLAFVYPGLGHVYLRLWMRAVMWFGFSLTTAILFVPESAVTAVQSGGLSAYLDATKSLPLETILPIIAVQVFNIVDAYWMALQRNHQPDDEDTYRCPECGKPVDEDLDFCQWCTAELGDYDATEADTDGGLISR